MNSLPFLLSYRRSLREAAHAISLQTRALCPQPSRPSQLKESPSLVKHRRFSRPHGQPPSSISPFLLQPLPADSQLLDFPHSSDQLFIFMYYPRLAITFFPLLSISTPLSSAQPLNVVSHLPRLPTIFSLCLPSLRSVEALNHTSVSSPLSLSLSPVPALQAGFTSRALECCPAGIRSGTLSALFKPYCTPECHKKLCAERQNRPEMLYSRVLVRYFLPLSIYRRFRMGRGGKEPRFTNSNQAGKYSAV